MCAVALLADLCRCWHMCCNEYLQKKIIQKQCSNCTTLPFCLWIVAPWQSCCWCCLRPCPWLSKTEFLRHFLFPLVLFSFSPRVFVTIRKIPQGRRAARIHWRIRDEETLKNQRFSWQITKQLWVMTFLLDSVVVFVFWCSEVFWCYKAWTENHAAAVL